MNSCEKCLNSRPIVSENGYHAVCCLSQKKAIDCMTGKKNHFITNKLGAITDFDKDTSKWFKKHPDAQTTVTQCEKCGLWYKPILGHKCEEESNES